MCQVCARVSELNSDIDTTLWHAGGDPNNPATDPNYNGVSEPAGFVDLTGNAMIDGILARRAWTDGSITYSFPDQASDYGAYPTVAPNTIQTLNTAQQTAVHFGMNSGVGPTASNGFSIEGFTNLDITFNGTGTGNSTMRFARSDDAQPTAYAYYPSSSVLGGDNWLGTQGGGNSLSNPQAGNYAWTTILHEIGHGMGLKHGHAADSGFTNANATLLPTAMDAMEFSIMTYRSYVGGPTTGYSNESAGYAQTFMMLDIAALQTMYGADFTTNSGNTVYKWNPTSGDTLVNGAVGIDAVGNRIFATIWDGGGIDTYDLSSYTTNLTINLMPGSSSLFSTVQRANLGAGNFASGNIYNALQFQGDARSLIEYAIAGSGNDFLIGNDAANALYGGLGADVLFHSAGGDLFNGGGGTDYVSFASGAVGAGQNMRIDLVNSGLNSGLALGDTFVEVEAFFLSQGNDLFSGDATNNFVFGQNGADAIAGAGGGDILYGEGGNDFINSGALGDLISGGSGADTFYYSINQIEQDSILDFTSGVDKIAFDDVGFNMVFQSVILGFNYVTTTSGVGFTATAPGQAQFIYYTDLGLLYADTDGAGGAAANLIAQFAGTPALLASDFAIL